MTNLRYRRFVAKTPSPTQGKTPDQRDALPTIDKPLLRGWLHLGAAPIALIGGMVLMVFAPTLEGRVSSAVFTLTAVMLFGTSAVYHRGNWSPKTLQVLRRMDHANIFLIIAGTYTPLTLILLDRPTATVALAIVWTGATLGLLSRILFLNAPRWVYVPMYVALGWVAMAYIGPFYDAGGAAVVTLIAVGGLCYTVGAVFYGFKWPGASARYFGFHEIFHSLTVAGFACHYIAVALAIFRA